MEKHIDNSSTSELVKKLAQRLIASGKTIATAESCTGGNIAHNITLLAGSSQYFLGGIVSYANEVKMNVLGVHKEDLEKYGAVSQAVVESMATGACKAIGSDYSVATSGIAGPGGGSDEKPVGTVWMAVSGGKKTVSKLWHFDGNREEIIEKATKTAIFMLLEIVC
jgi:PncC family amidohydrolase